MRAGWGYCCKRAGAEPNSMFLYLEFIVTPCGFCSSWILIRSINSQTIYRVNNLSMLSWDLPSVLTKATAEMSISVKNHVQLYSTESKTVTDFLILCFVLSFWPNYAYRRLLHYNMPKRTFVYIVLTQLHSDVKQLFAHYSSTSSCQSHNCGNYCFHLLVLTIHLFLVGRFVPSVCPILYCR